MTDPLPVSAETDDLEAEVDAAIAACGGDSRATIRALIVANSFLTGELESMLRSASHGFDRNRRRAPTAPEED